MNFIYREKGAGITSRLVVYCLLLAFPIFLWAQPDLSDLRNEIATGSAEEKRNALFEIRNLRSEGASRIAIPALSDSLEMIRATAVSSVVFLPRNEAVELLVPLLADKAPFVRRETASALGELGDASAAPALIRALQKESEIENRSAAAMALGRLDDVSAIEPLLAILKKKSSEPDEFLRSSAARSVGEIIQTVRFGKHQPLAPQNFLPDKYKEKLTANASVGPEASQILAKALPILTKVLGNSREAAETRRGAAFAVGALGTAEAREILRSHLTDSDPYLAEICKEALLDFPPNN
ncbi:MAG: HEAT repeat domain-containing protein [Acidobacteriota bacterium]